MSYISDSGVDIPSVDVVVSYGIPTHPKGYVHRVGRTARAGKSITLVAQYDLEPIHRIEKVVERKTDLWPTDKDGIVSLRGRVEGGCRLRLTELKDRAMSNGGGKEGRREDGEGGADGGGTGTRTS